MTRRRSTTRRKEAPVSVQTKEAPKPVSAKKAVNLMELMRGVWFVFNDPAEYWRLEHPLPDDVLAEVEIYTSQKPEDEVFAQLRRTGPILEVFWPIPMTGNLVIYPKL